MLNGLRQRLSWRLEKRAFDRYHKKLGVTDTKFDISFCVFRESRLQDQYGIRRFYDAAPAGGSMLFVDLGRNHGFVFLYLMDHMRETGRPTAAIDYHGIDPSPLKFVYFNDAEWLARAGVEVRHHLYDRAVVFDDARRVWLKYGEDNFGNFNVSGSNYEAKLKKWDRPRSFIEIEVDAMHADEALALLDGHAAYDKVIVKIDCKNRTDHLFTLALDRLQGREAPWMVACEQDGSAERDVSAWAVPGARTLFASNIV